MKYCKRCGETKPKNEFYKKRHSNYCRACNRTSDRQYRQENKEKINQYKKSYRQKNKVKIINSRKQYYQANKGRTTEYNRQYKKARRRRDTNYRIYCYMRSQIWKALKDNHKIIKTAELIGCSIEELKEHLENQFQPGMTWDNWSHNGWHIDHIIPCAQFDLSNPGQQRNCFHYTNLQPLWAEDNLRKGSSLN